MTPQDFIAKWGTPGGVPGPAYARNEEQALFVEANCPKGSGSHVFQAR